MMQIDYDLLLTWGAVANKYSKEESIFQEGGYPNFYYQIIEGQVKMINLNEEGKEFIQGIFYKGESFGEPPLFIGEPYPATAIVHKNAIIAKLSRESFLKILEEYPAIKTKFLLMLAQRIYSKSNNTRDIVNNASPEKRICAILKGIKKKLAPDSSTERILIPHTRQELANLMGLRVETVIRTLKTMHEQNKVEIINRDLYF